METELFFENGVYILKRVIECWIHPFNGPSHRAVTYYPIWSTDAIIEVDGAIEPVGVTIYLEPQ